MWTFKFDAPKNTRILSYGFNSVCVEETGIWFYPKYNKWLTDEERPEKNYGRYSSHHNAWEGSPRTFKAFKRYLNKHPELRNKTVTLVHKYRDERGFDYHIEATWVDEGVVTQKAKQKAA